MTNRIPPFVWRLLFAFALLAVFLSSRSRGAECPSCYTLATATPYVPQADSWVFAPSRYTHDPATGARVAQYDQISPVEPLPDQRNVTSGYSRTRTVLRGADGSSSANFVVTNYGNGRGGIDAEWERVHDAWRGATVGGGNFFGAIGGFPGFGPYGGGGYGPDYGGYGPGYGGGGYPGYGGGYPGGIPGPGFTSPSYGYGSAGPDPRRLDPDAADGYHDGAWRREPNQEFFRPIPKAGFQKEHHRPRPPYGPKS
ncbi:hypothetical protein [Bythopirellula goksoeyrii]|uniref:Uncharacterized protein n=1 Tax=Bythopirellula goksoeyrii TaxID=1400387 RepID=A0A5B9Q5H9_9BACT|nr:hypothetical protein [Bythopirellula goksoeyrii]QEG32990.1 hypothetical protein Pr1d_02510 [Bythopirellula goksoeyrii]